MLGEIFRATVPQIEIHCRLRYFDDAGEGEPRKPFSAQTKNASLRRAVSTRKGTAILVCKVCQCTPFMNSRISTGFGGATASQMRPESS